jgi:transcriptional regulator with XRE-family HTH domain
MSGSAALLVEARHRAQLSQAELARRAELPRSVLNAYERGKRQPGADALVAILAAAGFELSLEPRIDYERNARILSQVLDLAERLPWRPKKELRYPGLRRRAG